MTLILHPVSYTADHLADLEWLRPYADHVRLQAASAPKHTDAPLLWYGSRGLALYSPGIERPYRLEWSSYRPAPMVARALGQPQGAHILDACAGFGSDTMHLTAHNRVCFVDRNLIVCLMLSEFLTRSDIQAEVRWAEAETVLGADTRWDLIYLDPMFPARSKTALPKIDMQHLRAVQSDTPGAATEHANNEQALLARALGNGARKTVLKRRLKDPLLAKPTSQLRGRSVRFDVFARG